MDDFLNPDDDNDIEFDFTDDEDGDNPTISIGASLLEESLLRAVYGDGKNDIGPYDAALIMLDVMSERYGQQGAYLVMHAIENKTGWSMEIIGSKDEVEQRLWDEHSFFDADAWSKAKNSVYWDAMVRDVYQTTIKWMPLVIDDIASVPKRRYKRIKKLAMSLTSWLHNT